MTEVINRAFFVSNANGPINSSFVRPDPISFWFSYINFPENYLVQMGNSYSYCRANTWLNTRKACFFIEGSEWVFTIISRLSIEDLSFT